MSLTINTMASLSIDPATSPKVRQNMEAQQNKSSGAAGAQSAATGSNAAVLGSSRNIRGANATQAAAENTINQLGTISNAAGIASSALQGAKAALHSALDSSNTNPDAAKKLAGQFLAQAGNVLEKTTYNGKPALSGQFSVTTGNASGGTETNKLNGLSFSTLGTGAQYTDQTGKQTATTTVKSLADVKKAIESGDKDQMKQAVAVLEKASSQLGAVAASAGNAASAASEGLNANSANKGASSGKTAENGFQSGAQNFSLSAKGVLNNAVSALLAQGNQSSSTLFDLLR